MQQNKLLKDDKSRTTVNLNIDGILILNEIPERRVLPASQSQRCSLGGSAKYQYHHSMLHLEIMNIWINSLNNGVWTTINLNSTWRESFTSPVASTDRPNIFCIDLLQLFMNKSLNKTHGLRKLSIKCNRR